jgi:hypothetical protein
MLLIPPLTPPAPSHPFELTHSVAVVVSVLMSGLCALCAGACYAELCVEFPVSGGAFSYVMVGRWPLQPQPLACMPAASSRSRLLTASGAGGPPAGGVRPGPPPPPPPSPRAPCPHRSRLANWRPAPPWPA